MHYQKLCIIVSNKSWKTIVSPFLIVKSMRECDLVKYIPQNWFWLDVCCVDPTPILCNSYHPKSRTKHVPISFDHFHMIKLLF